MNFFKYIYLFITIFFLVTAVQAVPIESHFIKTVDSPATYDTMGQFIKVTSDNWYVIAGSYPQNLLGKKAAKKRLASIEKAGFGAFFIADSDDFYNLTDGLWVVMEGPYKKPDAKSLKNELRKTGTVRDAYVKRAW